MGDDLRFERARADGAGEVRLAGVAPLDAIAARWRALREALPALEEVG